MTPEELHEEWHSGESTGLRPKRIQHIRGDLMAVTGMVVPRRVPEIESWLERMKGQVTKQINQAVEEDGSE